MFTRDAIKGRQQVRALIDESRRLLQKHEIATVQATSIDGDHGLIRLTTTLVHASGEWVASDWPVCPVSETASPHRLGAALTYARRYALFTLVGIAGEDDLDAPDLPIPELSSQSSNGPLGRQRGPDTLNAPAAAIGRPLAAASKRGRAERPQPAALSPEDSDRLRRKLISEVKNLDEAEALAAWAHRALPLKNQLTLSDALAVEAAFTERLVRLGEPAPRSEGAAPKANNDSPSPPRDDRAANEVTVIGKPVPERDRNQLRFVAAQPCLVCGRTPSDPHHIKFAEQRAMGRKVSDRFTVPICRLHHRELHRRGNERAWWQRQGIDPLLVAAELWGTTHEVASSAADTAPEGIPPIELNGRRVINATGAAIRHQTDETKPIVRPGAE